MAKYTRKPSEIEAIQFVYSKNGAMDLKEFCGDKLVSVSKERHYDAIAEAIIKTRIKFDGCFLEEKIYEGDYVVKGSIIDLFVVSKRDFECDYEVI